MRRTNTQRGFTLVELLIVMVIIGVLAALIMVNFTGARERARDARRKADLGQIKSALRLYYNDYQRYPDDLTGGILGCGADGETACDWEGEFSAAGIVYMKYLPVDPLDGGDNVYVYEQTDSGDGFTLTTHLENGADQDAERSQRTCGVDEDDVEARRYMVCGD